MQSANQVTLILSGWNESNSSFLFLFPKDKYLKWCGDEGVSSKPSRGQSLLLFVYFQQPWECYYSREPFILCT